MSFGTAQAAGAEAGLWFDLECTCDLRRMLGESNRGLLGIPIFGLAQVYAESFRRGTAQPAGATRASA